MKRENNGLTSVPTTGHSSHNSALQQQIAERAYQLFQMRGGAHGNDIADWVRAEREVRTAWDRKQNTIRSNNPFNGPARGKPNKAA